MKTNDSRSVLVGSLLAVASSLLVLFLTLFGDSMSDGWRLSGSVVAVVVACGALGYTVAVARRNT